MATVYSGWNQKSYSWGSAKTRCRCVASSSSTTTATTVSVAGAVQCDSAYNLAQYGVKVTVGHKGGGGVAAASTSATGVFDGTTAWKASASKSYSFPRKTSAYTVTVYTSYAGATVSGYSACSNSGSVTYSVTVPALPSYKVTYSANGGSGAPSAQTKYHGVALKLSTTVPTRENYEFLGWATSSTATAAAYAAGASYTGNAALSLYAVWKLRYSPPTVGALDLDRCGADGALDDFGAYVRVAFSWSCDQTMGANEVASVTVAWSGGSAPVAASGTSGSVETVIGGGTVAADAQVSVTATVADGMGGSSSRTAVLPAAVFPLDVRAGGTGVAFGKPASKDGLDVGFPSSFDGDMTFAANNLRILGTSTSGTIREAVNPSGSSDQMSFGYGTYAESKGTTNLYGNAVSIASKGAVNITSPTAGISSRAYGVNKVLWSGGLHMTASHTATLSESVGKQPHGIVIVFSAYVSSAVQNYGWETFFVSKYEVASHGGTGHNFVLGTTKYGQIGNKYLYISGSKITGHADNSYTKSASAGVIAKIANNYWVMRYVIGV